MNNIETYSDAYYIDWIRETLDGHWRGSGNPVVVRYHLVPVLEQIPLRIVERFLEMTTEANDDCLDIIREHISERYLLSL